MDKIRKKSVSEQHFYSVSHFCVRHEHILEFLHNYLSTTLLKSINTSYTKITQLQSLAHMTWNST